MFDVRERRDGVTTSDELEAFCNAQYPRLVGALGLYCGDALLAEDLAQEALARVCEAWPRVQRMQSPGGWAHRVALNLANSHFRRQKMARRLGWAAATREQVSDGGDPGVRVDVLRALATLPARQRAVVVLRLHLDHSTADTAALLRLPEGTVKSLLHRGVERLRPLLMATERNGGRL
jgi:RNA polymerase sigma factor (sigma-70 family)